MRPLIACLLVLALAACDSKPQGCAARRRCRAEIGRQASIFRSAARKCPAIPFSDEKGGGPATLTQFRGKPLMVNLWATWCAPCIAEMPAIDAMADREKDRFRVITVSQDLQGDKVAPFFKEKGFRNLPQYLDQQNVLMQAFQTETLPTTIFFDAKGKEQWRVLGAMDWNGEAAKKLIDGALNPPG